MTEYTTVRALINGLFMSGSKHFTIQIKTITPSFSLSKSKRKLRKKYYVVLYITWFDQDSKVITLCGSLTVRPRRSNKHVLTAYNGKGVVIDKLYVKHLYKYLKNPELLGYTSEHFKNLKCIVKL